MTVRSNLASALSVSWNAFVAVFLYYTVLAMVTLSVGELSDTFVEVAYLAPVALYATALAGRAIRAVAAVRIDIGHTPHALTR